MSDQEALELKTEIRNTLKRVYSVGFRHGFAAALCGSIVYYFFI